MNKDNTAINTTIKKIEDEIEYIIANNIKENIDKQILDDIITESRSIKKYEITSMIGAIRKIKDSL